LEPYGELNLAYFLQCDEPVTTWKPKAIAEDALFHAIYAVAAGLTADLLIRRVKKAYKV